jgi:hypothetical protein
MASAGSKRSIGASEDDAERRVQPRHSRAEGSPAAGALSVEEVHLSAEGKCQLAAALCDPAFVGYDPSAPDSDEAATQSDEAAKHTAPSAMVPLHAPGAAAGTDSAGTRSHAENTVEDGDDHVSLDSQDSAVSAVY